jgi:hypothetical protein
MITIAIAPGGGIAVRDADDDVMRSFPDPSTWEQFRKQVPTKALRMDGPFRVETSEGPLTCEDGYLCLDARGYPYPVAREEFDLIYAPA